MAYFPMADHNPGPVQLLFHFILDMVLYLSESEDSIAAVHCKAGKGRTGIAICAYLIFMEAVSDTYEAVEFFNRRRTTDGKVSHLICLLFCYREWVSQAKRDICTTSRSF